MVKKRTVYTPATKAEASAAVLDAMRSGLSARKACEHAKVTPSVFWVWLRDDAELAERYARARDDLIERIADEILSISDQDVPLTAEGKKDWAAVQKQRLQVDSRKWLLSKLAPKKYGDRIEIAGDAESPLQIEHAIDASKLSTDVLAQVLAAKKDADSR